MRDFLEKTRVSIGARTAAVLLALASTATTAYDPPIPAQLWMTVRNTTVFAQSQAMVRSGVPLPRALDIRSTTGLAVVGENGAAVPATFRVLARWNAALTDANAPIQWLHVTFPANVPANSQTRWRLVINGSIANPAPATPLSVVRVGNQITVNTGVARFVVGGNAARVFDEIREGGGSVLVNGGSLGAALDGGALMPAFNTVRAVRIEHQDALAAVVTIEGTYPQPADGGGVLAGSQRYVFSAGSRAATVRTNVQWEGTRCGAGQIDCNGGVNARRLDRWQIVLTPSLTGTRSVTLLGDVAAPAASATIAAGQSARLRQLRKPARTVAQQFELAVPGQATITGTRADGGVLTLAGTNGMLGVALAHMDWYEPQALRVLADGSVAVQPADDAVWLGARQGTVAEFRIGAYAAGTTSAAVIADLWPATNAPLLALPDPAWIAASRATEEFPVGPLPAAYARYDTVMNTVLDNTVSYRRNAGLQGLMTFGLFPRQWGDPVNSDEIDCGGDNDPTPADDWDDPYWCATWTDYHNASAISVYAAFRHTDPARLYEISFPAAMRSLHTQIQRCAPDDDDFYCGQAPTGYRGYRSDNNSSHQYFDNLMLYYWMTGDETVRDTLRRGATSFRAYLCPSRGGTPPGPVCAPNTPITDNFARVNDRVTSQFYSMFRFVGLTSDASFLDDWRSNVARWLTRNFALLNHASGQLGFIELSGCENPILPETCVEAIDGPGQYNTTQLWMASLYDMNGLYRLDVDTNNTALGSPAIAPRTAYHGWARALALIAQTPPGDGTVQGIWPNTARFTYSGARIGGTLTQLAPGWSPGPMPNPCLDNCLYVFGKGALTGAVARAADDLDNGALRILADDLVQQTLDLALLTPQPLGKAMAEYLSRTHAAIARLNNVEVPIFADGFE